MIQSVALTAIGCLVSAYGGRPILFCSEALSCSICPPTPAEINLTFLGIAYLLLNFLSEAMRLCLMQHLLVAHEWQPMQGLMMINPPTAVSLLLTSWVLEYPEMKAKGDLVTPFDNVLIFSFAASLGLLINLISLVTIKVVGSALNPKPYTHSKKTLNPFPQPSRWQDRRPSKFSPLSEGPSLFSVAFCYSQSVSLCWSQLDTRLRSVDSSGFIWKKPRPLEPRRAISNAPAVAMELWTKDRYGG